MGHPVKCFFCGERFDRDFEPFRKVSANRYAHKHCAMEAKKSQKLRVLLQSILKMVPLLVLKKRRKVLMKICQE